ncbi:MAG: transcription elongation factor GreA [Deltaproteobacteria bacterium RBG_13_61_14]|nr:MAG: transcription elongation factor GreA [Deltaproteobacteria bacterium RBG_13_61_14]
MADRVPMTTQGRAMLREELKRLKEDVRHKLAQEIGRARELGDLTENAEYHAAKEKQGQVEAQIRDMENRLGRAEVVDVSKLRGSKVLFGATVTVEDEDGERQVLQIVGAEEADPKAGKISYESPVARGLIGKEEGDTARIQTPRGPKELEVIKVEFI